MFVYVYLYQMLAELHSISVSVIRVCLALLSLCLIVADYRLSLLKVFFNAQMSNLLSMPPFVSSHQRAHVNV